MWPWNLLKIGNLATEAPIDQPTLGQLGQMSGQCPGGRAVFPPWPVQAEISFLCDPDNGALVHGMQL
jgi:hypothetical protein